MAAQAPQTQRTPRFSVANAKGGVGKTTVAVSLAGAFNDLGYDGLFVDADPQGNATEAFGQLGMYDADPPTVFDALFDDPAVATDLIVSHDEVDLLPANVDMLAAEREFVIAELMGEAEASGFAAESLTPLAQLLTPSRVEAVAHPYGLLDSVLDGVAGAYDYVVVDCPPAHGAMLKNVLYAAPNLIVPANAEATSKGAVERLFDEVVAFEEDTGRSVTDVAAFVNRIRHSTNEADRMTTYLEQIFDNIPVYRVRERVAFSYAYESGSSIFSYDETVDMCEVFRGAAQDLAADFLEGANA